MSADYGVKFNGHQMTVNLDNATKAWLKAVGRKIKSRAKALCPVESGELRKSISMRIIRDGKGVQVVAGHKKNRGPVFYARMVEFGTRRSRAHPFMRPAFEAVKSRAMEMLRDEAGKVLK